MSDSSRKAIKMREPREGFSELRLILHCYPRHTTAALVTRRRDGRENWDSRQHAWDIPLPQEFYERYKPEDQLWVILAGLAAVAEPPRSIVWAEPPEPPVGGYRGLQDPLPDVLWDA